MGGFYATNFTHEQSFAGTSNLSLVCIERSFGHGILKVCVYLVLRALKIDFAKLMPRKLKPCGSHYIKFVPRKYHVLSCIADILPCCDENHQGLSLPNFATTTEIFFALL